MGCCRAKYDPRSSRVRNEVGVEVDNVSEGGEGHGVLYPRQKFRYAQNGDLFKRFHVEQIKVS